jgi:hypothetical protein
MSTFPKSPNIEDNNEYRAMGRKILAGYLCLNHKGAEPWVSGYSFSKHNFHRLYSAFSKHPYTLT